MWRTIALLTLPALTAACAAESNSVPLVFGTATTLGVSVGANPANAGTPEFTLGFKRAEIAVVPTVIPKDAITELATKQEIVATGVGEHSETDALSTFGSFASDSTTQSVGLGTFFATGVAAQNLSNGFKCKLANGTHYECNAPRN